MKKIILSGLFLGGVLSTSALVHLPAQFVVQYVPLPNQLSLVGVEGTVWQGSAHQVTWNGQNYGQLNWQLSPSQLLAAKLEAKVRFGRGSDIQLQGRGVVGYASSGPYAENVIASMPVTSLLEVAPSLPVPLDLNGQVELSLRSYAYAAPFCQAAEGSLVWNTDVIGSPLAELATGPIVAQFNCQDSKVEVSAEQSSDQVVSSANVTLEPNRSYVATAWFKPQSDFPSELTQQLKWLPNQADSQGKFPFTYRGRL
ncbi:type II secretion system protein N [Vibrio ouci]|uniref:Type II secretion system protein N n=1 Tax=Vibrio ouci TaxID=2499078 RepID=A0A4Y8WJ25_9VIBR|nr:type II secretion system protein N [Vibrio ouci]TFH92937.1 type II secretion system protein N [Vibrio ouci]